MIYSCRFLCVFIFVLLLFSSEVSHSQNSSAEHQRILVSEATVNAPLEKVWWGWTTDKGVQSFFAADSKIDFRVGGNYNVSLYNKDFQSPTQKTILSFIPFQRFIFEYPIPDKFQSIRNQKTEIIVEFIYRATNETDVKLTQLGWGKNGEWDAAYDYFQQTWLLVMTDMQTHLPKIKPSEEYNTQKAKESLVAKKVDSSPAKTTASKAPTPPKSSKYSFNPSAINQNQNRQGVKQEMDNKPKNNSTINKDITKKPPIDMNKPTEKQQFAYLLTLTDPELARNPKSWTKEQTDIVGVHFNHLKKLTEEGTVIMAGRSPDPEKGFGIVIFEASSKAIAEEIMNSDPAVKHGLMAAEIHNFRVALMRKQE